MIMHVNLNLGFLSLSQKPAAPEVLLISVTASAILPDSQAQNHEDTFESTVSLTLFNS